MTEKEVLNYWSKNKIFEKSQKQGDKDFVFYEGPPSANGRPGIHHTETRAFKDAVCRYKAMRGFKVERRAGWDTQGLPIENQAAKELGLAGKKDIENYTIEKFNQKCREIVWGYKKEWEEVTNRFGFWLDMENAYITYTPQYIESLWGIFKKISDRTIDGQSLVYQDRKVVPHCPKCETTLSSHEVAQGYQDIKERSIYVKFELKNKPNHFFLVWTTTPWTLPANVALAVGVNANYVVAQYEDNKIILEKNRAIQLGIAKYEKVIKGSELIGEEYKPLFQLNDSEVDSNNQNYKVYTSEFVSTEEGTGIVHIAPAFGEEDFKLGKENSLSMPLTIDTNGIVTAEVPGTGLFVKEADEQIILDLTERDLFFRQEDIVHTYPFCWRCDGPLLYLLKPSWFIAMSKLRQEILANNEQINWVPAHIKHGRFGNFLVELKDWAISREKFWGTPIPIWKCNECSKIEVIGSFKELETSSGKKLSQDFDPHRPFIDKIKWKCECGKGTMTRIPEVIDVWFDSGGMPYASGEYDKHRFPADFITEAIDQTRGWFYTLLAISTALKLGPAYKNVITLGLVLDKNGKKMSKSRGNIILPLEIMEKYSADALRWYFYTINQPAELKKFNDQDIAAIQRGYISTWNNLLNFYNTYQPLATEKGDSNILDLWVNERVKETNIIVINAMDNYDLVSATRALEVLLDDISNWYLRRSRKRLTKAFFKNFSNVLITTAKLSAPFTPFISESIYQALNPELKSIHLESIDLPSDKPKIEILKNMQITKEIVKTSLAIRVESGIKVRQPLRKLILPETYKLKKELLDIIAEELNVKHVEIGKVHEITLDTTLDDVLKKEGLIAEITRQIQVLRKNNQMKPSDNAKIIIYISGELEIRDDLTLIEKNTNSHISLSDKKIDGTVLKFDKTEVFVKLCK